jgi:organic radical activating enzyme
MKSYVQNTFLINRNITVNFNGGEPLLDFPLLKFMVEEFQKNGINKFSVSTNFTLVSDETLDFLAANNFSIQLSVDGKKSAHDAFRAFQSISNPANRAANAPNERPIPSRTSQQSLNAGMARRRVSPIIFCRHSLFLTLQEILWLSPHLTHGIPSPLIQRP